MVVGPFSSVGARRAVIASRRNRSYISLRARSEFSRIYREGGRTRKGTVVVISAPADSGMPHVGFVAGRSVGNAVQRNRAKRRLREALARVELQQGMTYVVIAQRGINDASFCRIERWLEDACGVRSSG